MSAYPQYKECDGDWIIKIPVDWDILRGKFLFEIKKRIAGEIGYDVLSITQKGIKVKDIESGDGQLSMDYSKYQIVEPGDFAMNHMDLLTGYVDISRFTGVTSPDYRVFSAKEIASCSRFYLYVFQMGYTNKIFFKYGQGASHLGRWRLPTEEFNNFWFPCPPKEDRARIADFLDYEIGRVDDLVEKQQQLIKLLKEKRQAVISHAVTKGLNPNVPMRDSGVDWLGEVPEHWDVKRLKYLCDVQTGSRDTVNAVDEGEYPFFVRSQTVERINSMAFDCEAVLTAGDGAGVGKVYHYINGPFDFHQRVYMLNNFRHVTGRFIFNYLEQNFYKVAMAGQAKSTVDSLRLPLFLNFEVTIPPKEEIKAILSKVGELKNKYQALISSAENAIKLLQERRTALISAAITGKIDMRNWKAPKKAKLKRK